MFKEAEDAENRRMGSYAQEVKDMLDKFVSRSKNTPIKIMLISNFRRIEKLWFCPQWSRGRKTSRRLEEKGWRTQTAIGASGCTQTSGHGSKRKHTDVLHPEDDWFDVSRHLHYFINFIFGNNELTNKIITTTTKHWQISLNIYLRKKKSDVKVQAMRLQMEQRLNAAKSKKNS